MALGLKRTPYAITVWDSCHIDYPEFPEVRAYGEFERRHNYYLRSLPQALLVITDSAQLSERLHRRYGVDYNRLLVQRFRPSPYLDVDGPTVERVLNVYGLEPGYWFYPAQFWAHKNHVRVLEALLLLRQRGIDQRVVFTGSDKGFRGVVEDHARRLGMTGNVRFLGFVPSEHLRGLYLGSIGLVFPSYFGPTNLPPLEALALGKSVVCSDFHKPSLGSTARYFAPDDPVALADQLEAVVRERDGFQSATGTPTEGSVESETLEEFPSDDDATILRGRIDVLARRLGMLRAPQDERQLTLARLP